MNDGISLIRDQLQKKWGEIKHVGCADLYARIIQTEVKLHVFGHIHFTLENNQKRSGFGLLNDQNCFNFALENSHF